MNDDEMGGDSAAASAAPEPGGDVLAAVSALMEERRRFEGWLAALDVRRAATPDHVFARVHADYSGRLHTVIEQLTTHAGGLRRELESLTDRLGVLREERHRVEDSRAEAELRAHVGELSAEDWTSTAATSDASLADIGERHQAMEHELARTRELLEAAERPAPAAPPEPEPEEVAPASPEPAAPVTPDPAHAAQADESPHIPAVNGGDSPVAAEASHVPLAPELGASEPATASQDADSGARQQSLGIVEHVMPRESKATPHPSPNAIPPRYSSFDELAFLSSVVDTPAGSIELPPADMPDEKTRLDSFARRSQEDAIVNLSESGSVPLVPPVPTEYEHEPYSALSSGSQRSLGRESTGVDGTKTLKCSECSAMNYPTEWYCERCGAELASL